MSMMKTSKCTVCGKEIEILYHAGNIKYCKDCYIIKNRENARIRRQQKIAEKRQQQKFCIKCGKPLESSMWRAKYCDRCREIMQYEYKLKHMKAKNILMEHAICENCGQTFERPIQGKQSPYCFSCRVDRARLEDHTFQLSCDDCGKTFESKTYKAHYCPDCKIKRRQEYEKLRQRENQNAKVIFSTPMADPWELGLVYSGSDPSIAGMCQLYG